MADSIPDILEAQASPEGEIVVVTDDDDREGEGRSYCCGHLCTAEKMAFIDTPHVGIVCAPVTSEDARRLRLGPMVAHNDSRARLPSRLSITTRPA